MAEIILQSLLSSRAFLSLLAFVENASWDEMHCRLYGHLGDFGNPGNFLRVSALRILLVPISVISVDQW